MSEKRQKVVRVAGSRRAKLTPVAGTMADPEIADDGFDANAVKPSMNGPNDERMMRDVPPHY